MIKDKRPIKPPLKQVKRKPIIVKPKFGSKPPVEYVDIPESKLIPLYPKKKIIAISAIALAVLLLILIAVWPKSTNCDYDNDCFIEKADNCKPAVVRGTIGDGTIVKYSTKNCILTKEIESFSETEPQQVIDFFKNKKLTCKYEKQNFNGAQLFGLSIGIEDCEGELKDAIEELRLAQLALE